MDYIERFKDLATSIKANGVSSDYLFCKIFPCSLVGVAAYWLKQLKHVSLTTWEATKTAFLNNFYDDTRSEDLRMKISIFTQGPTEAFKAAWIRFITYQRDCPHHGFSEIQLLGIFFRRIDWRYHMALDAASNRSFNTRNLEDACVLIENLASSNRTKNANFDRKKQAAIMNGSQIAEVKAKLVSVHNLLVNKKSVHFAAEFETFEHEEEFMEEDVNYVNGAGYQGQRFGNNQGNYRNFNGNGQRNNYTGNQNFSGYTPKPEY
ncbi:hypothetical protein V5N11_021645 [Cardamine amara subsp. amara]|uniref:Retrotransposon gag domain-containing protein n=1 Tax=Cardamine amara subsp. amara TaxID=228776 RepID=A0ABD0ZVC2_CARAN